MVGRFIPPKNLLRDTKRNLSASGKVLYAQWEQGTAFKKDLNQFFQRSNEQQTPFRNHLEPKTKP